MPPQRTSAHDHYHYDPIGSRHTSKHESRRGPWSPQEDKLLKELVAQHSAGNWVAIQNGIVSRTAKQCRERWHQNLDPKLNHDPITPEEGQQIDALVEKMGKRWADIARHLNGRSDNAVKNWWNGGENRRRREQARVESTFYQRSPYTQHQERFWSQPSPTQWSPQTPTYQQQPQQQPQPSYRPGPTLAPILSHPHEQEQRTAPVPAPLSIPIRSVPRDIPSPAVSLPSMTDDPASPQSYTRRDSIQVQTPTAFQTTPYASESMVRTTSDTSARSEGISRYRPEIVHPSSSPKLHSTANNNNAGPSLGRTLPPIDSLLSAPISRELSHLINPSQQSQGNRSPVDNQLRLPPLGNINRH